MEGDGMETLLTRALKLVDAAVEWAGVELDAAWKAHAEAEAASRANPSEEYEREQVGEASGRAWVLAGQHGRLLDIQRMLDRAAKKLAKLNTLREQEAFLGVEAQLEATRLRMKLRDSEAARRAAEEKLVSLRVATDDALHQCADARAALCRIAQISNQYRERS